MSKFIYEIVDATDDEIYYPIGMFEDLDFCKEMLKDACPHQAISDRQDQSETIEIRRHKINSWGEQGACVFSVYREATYLEEFEEDVWKSEITKDIKLEKAK